MIILPENKPTDFDKTPRMFLVWGGSMTGKTYFARQFPNPILLNTDGNARKVDTPSIDILNFKHFTEVITTLEKTEHSFETIIIDLVDDIEMMLINDIIEDENRESKKNYESLADFPFGKGYSLFKSKWKQLMMYLSKLRFNIIFISHIVTITEKDMRGNDTSHSLPSLSNNALNACLGRCDLQLQTLKIGNTYTKLVTSKRDNYKHEDIKNPIIYNALKDTQNLFERVQQPINNINNNINNK